MPIINLKVSGQENPALAKELVKVISDITKDILNKKPHKARSETGLYGVSLRTT